MLDLILTPSITTLSILDFIAIFSKTTLSVKTFSITTLNILDLI